MSTKKASLIFSIILIVVLLSGCATPTAAPAEPTQAAQPTTAAATEAPQPTTAVATDAPKPPAPAAIEIGASVPLTGKYGSMGAQVQAGYELGVEAVNAAGGVYVKEYDTKIPLKLTIYDDESDPTKAVSKLESLYSEQQVTAYLGGAGSDMHAATTAIAEKNKVPYLCVSFALYKIHQQGYKYLFSPFPKSPNQTTDVY